MTFATIINSRSVSYLHLLFELLVELEHLCAALLLERLQLLLKLRLRLGGSLRVLLLQLGAQQLCTATTRTVVTCMTSSAPSKRTHK